MKLCDMVFHGARLPGLSTSLGVLGLEPLEGSAMFRCVRGPRVVYLLPADGRLSCPHFGAVRITLLWTLVFRVGGGSCLSFPGSVSGRGIVGYAMGG